MRDGIYLTKIGHPVVVLVHDYFEKAAKAQAKALGVPDLKIYVFPQHKPGDTAETEAIHAAKAVQDITEILPHKA